MNGRIVGSVAIDGEDLAPGEAHLRWFILDDGCRGHGVGKKTADRSDALLRQCWFLCRASLDTQ